MSTERKIYGVETFFNTGIGTEHDVAHHFFLSKHVAEEHAKNLAEAVARADDRSVVQEVDGKKAKFYEVYLDDDEGRTNVFSAFIAEKVLHDTEAQ